MDLPTYFEDFLSEIRMTQNQRNEAKSGHERLRNRLTSDDDVKQCIVSTFIQGSYRRATAIRPSGGKRSDVDVIIVTDLSAETWSPAEVLAHFKGVLEKYYPGKCTLQGRSIGIELSAVDLDVVVTSAPSEAIEQISKSAWLNSSSFLDEQSSGQNSAKLFQVASNAEQKWKSEPLLIPDRETSEWQRTDPLSQIAATAEKNALCHGHFVNAVKAIKWWRVSQDTLPKYPKGYPLERLITESCPNDVSSVAMGVVLTLEGFIAAYQNNVLLGQVPVIKDYGVPEHDVLKRVSFEDFEKLYRAVENAALVARAAYEENEKGRSACLWRDLFGAKFPAPPEGCTKETKSDGFVAPAAISSPGRTRFA